MSSNYNKKVMKTISNLTQTKWALVKQREVFKNIQTKVGINYEYEIDILNHEIENINYEITISEILINYE